MIEELELRSEIARAIDGDVSLNALYSWLMARSWNMHKDSNPAAVALANTVEDLFFDRADGAINDPAMLEALSSLMRTAVVSLDVTDSRAIFTVRRADRLPNLVTIGLTPINCIVNAVTRSTTSTSWEPRLSI